MLIDNYIISPQLHHPFPLRLHFSKKKKKKNISPQHHSHWLTLMVMELTLSLGHGGNSSDQTDLWLKNASLIIDRAGQHGCRLLSLEFY